MNCACEQGEDYRIRLCGAHAEEYKIRHEGLDIREREAKTARDKMFSENTDIKLQIHELQEIVDLAVDLGGVSFHEESCPQDDTCFCVDVARVNKAMNGFEPKRQAGSVNLPMPEKPIGAPMTAQQIGTPLKRKGETT